MKMGSFEIRVTLELLLGLVSEKGYLIATQYNVSKQFFIFHCYQLTIYSLLIWNPMSIDYSLSKD